MLPWPPMGDIVRWDVFCRVVDNLGDAGVCWRLVKQLAREFDIRPRLWIDDLEPLVALAPELTLSAHAQVLEGVEVCRWQEDWADIQPARVVIEAFACELPPPYLEKMAAQDRPPVWLNLEYLSAEEWVSGCHGLCSPHPKFALKKYFFFPGFRPGTGGLTRESSLITARQTFLTSENAEFWQHLGVPSPSPGQKQVSLFCYEQAPVVPLLTIWSQQGLEVRVLVPPGKPRQAVAQWLNGSPYADKGSVHLQAIPFVSQAVYDQLLWACDLNFVRGEDSFVRAQWAGKPMVWHIYPQADGAHLDKLEAYLEARGLPENQRAFWRSWNTGHDLQHLASWIPWEQGARDEATQWCQLQEKHPDLASSLVSFVSRLI